MKGSVEVRATLKMFGLYSQSKELPCLVFFFFWYCKGRDLLMSFSARLVFMELPVRYVFIMYTNTL